MASKPCLPVSKRRKARADEKISFDSIETMDATEYLSRVVQQSNRLPEILLSDNFQQESLSKPSKKFQNHVPIEGSAATLSYLVSDRTAILPPPSPNHVPANCREWADQTLANFSQLRLYLEKIGQTDRKQAVPSMKDRPGWHIFCLGIKEARGNAGSYFAEEEDEEDERRVEEKNDTENSGTPNDVWRDGLPPGGYKPSTSLVLQLDQVMIRRVISHLVHYVQDGYPCSAQRSQWLYSLLARLEKPVHRNDAAALYGLLKALTRARATQTNDKEDLARLNVLITIVGIYFEQGGGYAGVMEIS